MTLIPSRKLGVILSLPDLKTEVTFTNSQLEALHPMTGGALLPPGDTLLQALQALAATAGSASETSTVAVVAFLHLFLNIAARDGSVSSGNRLL